MVLRAAAQLSDLDGQEEGLVFGRLDFDGAGATVIAADHMAQELGAVPVSQIKGLEYDRVILVEPADIVAAEPRGMNRLYVALTRAVASLVVLHRKPLPEVFTR